MFSPRVLRYSLPLALLLSSCGPPDRVEVTKSRELVKNEVEPVAGLTDRQRFAENTMQRALDWKTPEGWRWVAPTEFREINFSFGPSGEGECYLSLVTGEGSMLDNINRWRKQVGQPDITPEDVAKLPTVTVFGRQVPTIDVTGTFNAGSGPMMPSAGPPKENWRIVASLMEGPGGLVTIKMTGPKDLLEQNVKAYESFVGSLTQPAVSDR